MKIKLPEKTWFALFDFVACTTLLGLCAGLLYAFGKPTFIDGVALGAISVFLWTRRAVA